MFPPSLPLSPPFLPCHSIELEDYPYYMCLAYKLPQNYAFSLMFQLRGLNYWHSAYFINDVISLSGTTISMGSIVNLGGSDYIIDDNKSAHE